MRRIISPPPASPSFDLIPIPSEPIRELWIKRYRLMEKKLEKLKREWKLFEQDSVPHYQKWYHSTFWNELGRVNDWNEKAREQQRIMMAIVAHQQIYRLNELEAYARVRERIQQKLDVYPDPEDIEQYEKKQRERAMAEQKRREENQRRRQEAAEKFWASQAEADSYSEQIEDAFTKMFDDEPSRHESNELTKDSSREQIVFKKQDDLKSLYRSIVRELHPDTGYEMTDVEKEWWNQAQLAYRKSDLETLKLLALKIHGRGRVCIENVEQISTLIDLCTAILDQQDQIERQKRRLKKDPIYRFWTSRTKPTFRDKLAFEIKAELQQKFRRLKDFVSEVKARLGDLEHMSRYEDSREDEEYNPRERPRANLGGRGRGRGRGR
jgi:hypothetical protein